MQRSVTTEALVLKRTNTGETDRVITLLTRDEGKITSIAKGVRQLKSSKRAFVEPGNHIKCSLVLGYSLPILTQATLVTDVGRIRDNLIHIRQLLQLLEMVDSLFVAEENQGELFDQIMVMHSRIISGHATADWTRSHLERLIIDLGYQPFSETKYQTIGEYVSFLADKPLKSWEYLKI